MDGKGLQVAKLGRRTCSLWGIRGYVFYGPRGDASLLSRRNMGRNCF